MFPANELYDNTVPKCPYCYHSHEMAEWRGDDGSLVEHTCEKCEKVFVIRTRIEVVYDTVGDCEANKQMPHKLKVDWEVDDSTRYSCVNCKMETYNSQMSGGQYEKLSLDKYEIVE